MAHPTGLCECGCGSRTNIFKGTPRRFVNGHHKRLPQIWTEEDRGYDTPCHIWQGGRSTGYGWSVTGTFAHRAVWAETYGPIPMGYVLHHLCRQKDCVRVEHLTLMTQTRHRKLHPESKRPNKLSAEAVQDIRVSPLSLKDIAEKYEISKPYAANVRKGFAPREFAVNPQELPYRAPTPQKSWNKGKSKLTVEAVADIRASEIGLRRISEKHGITPTYAWKIRTGQVLSHL